MLVMTDKTVSILANIDSGEYHQAEMLCKSHTARLIKDRKRTEVNDLLTSVLAKLATRPPADLADNPNFLLGLLEIATKNFEDCKSEETFPAALLQSFLSLFALTPFSMPKAKALQKLNKTFFASANDSISTFLTRDALKSANYSLAQNFSLLLLDAKLAISLLDKWASEGGPDEKVWFVARYVLYKLASDRISDARLIFTHYSSEELFAACRPLGNFLRFLLKAIDLQSAEVFLKLREKFAEFLRRDPEFSDILDRIGTTHFGIVKERQPSMLEMMSRMMGM